MSDITSAVNNLRVTTNEDPLLNNNEIDDCETAEEAVTSDSEDNLSQPLRFRSLPYSSMSSVTVTQPVEGQNDNFYSMNSTMSDSSNIQIPIVGYEVMEERARFTVYKLRIENPNIGDCWCVFRRYTDFVRLCSRLKYKYPHIVELLPRKKWLGNNFEPLFLEERANKLQSLVNAILTEPGLLNTSLIQDFFCLNEPPAYSETNEESRAMLEALEETVSDLRQQLRAKESLIDTLEEQVRTTSNENDHLKKTISNLTNGCKNCRCEIEP